MLSMDAEFKAKVVSLILQKKPEVALGILSEKYSIRPPNLRVGKIKRYRKCLGAYVHSENTIYVSSSERLNDPRIVLHEFYHHLRYASGSHKGNEKYADRFAGDFIVSYIGLQQRVLKSKGLLNP
jgi:hypothetical protein